MWWLESCKQVPKDNRKDLGLAVILMALVTMEYSRVFIRQGVFSMVTLRDHIKEEAKPLGKTTRAVNRVM